MPYLYPYISIYRGPKKGEELRKYLISHMKGMDEVALNNKNLSAEFQATLQSFNKSQSEKIRQVEHLRGLINVLQQIEEESQVLIV